VEGSLLIYSFQIRWLAGPKSAEVRINRDSWDDGSQEFFLLSGPEKAKIE